MADIRARDTAMPTDIAQPLNSISSKVENFFWEKRLGISTRGIVATEELCATNYMTLSYHDTFRILESLDLGERDVFVDIGCGKGRMVCCASLFGVREVIGIEQSRDLCAAAEANAARMRGKRAPITMVHLPAEEFDYRDGTVFYFYNPFTAPILNAVLAVIRRSLDQHRRPVRLVYANPEFESCLEACDWLEKYDFWRPSQEDVAVNISFWRSKLPPAD
jgi:SAM-dependent methyltransferase